MDPSQIVSIVPPSSGVYLFYGASRQLLYVGKANDLRRRISQHLSGRGSSDASRIRVMRSSVDFITWVNTPSELHSLLLEDVLIKRCGPIFNKRQKKIRLQVWLLLEMTETPRLRLLETPPDSGVVGNVFGPFKDRFIAERLAEIIRTYYGVKTSLRYSGRGNRIPRGVTGNVFHSASRQAPDAAGAARFLSGRGQELLSRLESEMKRRSKETKFAAAAQLRDTLVFCHSFFKRQQFGQSFRDERLTMYDSLAGGLYTFERGDLKSYNGDDDDSWRSWLRYDGIVARTTSLLLDRTTIVYGWLNAPGKNRTGRFEPLDEVTRQDVG